MKMKQFWFKANPLIPPGPAIDQTSLCYGKARRGVGRIRGQILCFRVMGVITDPLCIVPAQVYVCGGGGGSKNWASFVRVILGILVVSLQCEPADARVLVEQPVPRCPGCTPVLFGVHVISPPPPPDNYFIIIPCETNIFSCHGEILYSLLEYFHHSDVRTEFLH